jgi:RecB family exonuclease
MLDGGATLTWAPAYSSALPHARRRWRERGGLLVVPRREIATRALLDEVGEGAAILGREALTFAGLRGRVAAAAGVEEPQPPSRIEVRLGLRQVLDRADLSAFGDSARAPGFLSAVERAVGELRAARAAPERVAAAATTPVAAALAAIHADAWRTLPHPSDALWAVAHAAAGFAAFPPVTVSGFDDLVPGQWALLNALARATPVEVVMPFDPARPAFEARRARQARWAAEAAVAPIAEAPAPGPPALARRLFDDGPPAPDPPALRLVGAAGTRGMLRAALDEVLDAVAGGVPLPQVALVVPRLADVRDDLERLLADWAIPARHATRMRALEAPLALALVHLLRLGEREPDAPGALDHLLGWLRTPYSGADPAEVDRFEVDARRGGITGRGELVRRWDGEAIAPARRLVAAARSGPRAQLAAMVELGWQALRRAGAADALPAWADLRDRSALAALSGLAGALGDDPADFDGTDEAPARPRGPLPPGVLGELVADLTFEAREQAPGGLDVHDFASLRGHRYEVVVVAGLDGDGFPPGPAADALLADLRAPLADALPARAPGTSESRLRFAHAVDSARSGLVLVRRTVDDEGRELAPSPYWLEACRVAGRPFDELDRTSGARGEVADAPAAARSEREALRAMALDGQVAPGLLAEVAARRTRPVGVGAGAFRDRTPLRVTELEAFLRCPYGWFHDAYLSPAEMEVLIDPRFEGTLAHAVLHATYERMRAEEAGPCGPATLDRYRATLESMLAAVCDEQRPAGAGAVYDALQERLRRHLGALLGREAALGSALVPTHFEHRMEDDDLVAAVAPGVAITGTVDRLDLSESGACLVVDYKRTGSDFTASADDVLRRLQLPLYGRMAHRTLGLSSPPAGGLYMGILSPKISGAVCDDVAGAPVVGRASVTRAVWDEIADEAVAAARDAVARIREGRLDAPAPSSCSHWCRCEDLWR